MFSLKYSPSTSILWLFTVLIMLTATSGWRNTAYAADTVRTDNATDDDSDGIPNGIECLAFIGKVPVAVVNGSFETPDVDKTDTLASKHWGALPQTAVAYKSSMVEGWSTTATDAEIEIWQSGFNGVPAYRGDQFAEINANQTAALYQDLTTTPGSVMYWSFAHRGRTGVDTIALQVGIPQGPYTTLGTFKTGDSAWAVYTGQYAVPAGQTKTRFFYQAVATANENTTTGNFLDDIQFYTLESCKLDTDKDDVVNSSDRDSDNDGIADIHEAGLTDTDKDGVVDKATDHNSAGSVPDSDGDQLPDFLDLDADGDGVPDVVEAQTTKDYQAPSGKADDKGIDKAFEKVLQPINSDDDELPDYLDTDSDNDQVSDTNELKLILSGQDSDRDGLDNEVDRDSKNWGPVSGKVEHPLQPYPNDGQELPSRSDSSKTATTVAPGNSGGLESGPLPGTPSTFIGGIGGDQSAEAAAAEQTAETWHKARLLAEMKLTLDDLMPATGPNGTTPQPSVPVDVLAVTNAPDAKAVDFVDSTGQTQAVVLGIISVGKPYMHDYGVCNRFKGYTFNGIAPLAITVPPDNEAWFWHSYANQGESIKEDALLFHIFVNEATKEFHIDSKWTQDGYSDSFAFAFDYVFNMQIWSNDFATSQQLLQALLIHLNNFEDGSWQVRYHNEGAPVEPNLYVRQIRYAADTVYLDLKSLVTATQTVHIYGSWRSHLDRQTLQPFDLQSTAPAGESVIPLNFPGVLDATIYVESNGFTDKVYTGGGLWFNVAKNTSAKAELSLSGCRTLVGIDPVDLILAGCATVKSEPATQPDEVGMGRTLNPNGRPVDVSPYKAIRFWAKGDNTPIRLILESAGISDGDYYQTSFTPDNTWRQYIIPLSQFQQRGFGKPVAWTGTDARAVVWVNAEVTGRALALAIDQVSFTNNALIQVNTLAQNNSDSGPRAIQMSVPEGADVISMTLNYSLDGGRTFTAIPMNNVQAANAMGLFQGELPAQPLGSDVRYYVTAAHGNGYTSQSPVDAPRSFYRYRVDDRTSTLVDDFGGSSLKNRLGGGSGLFNNTTNGGQLRAYLFEQQLVLDYNVAQEEQFAGYFTQLPQSDLRGYMTLNLLVRGEQGGEQFLVGMRDSHGFEPRLSVGDLLAGGITTAWQWVQIPLTSFSGELDRASIETISFTFFHSYAPTSGRVYLREMRLTGLATPVVIDTFDDGNLQSNGQGNSYWTAAPNSVLVPALVTGDANKSSGSALQLAYTVNTGGYAIWHSNLNNVALPADALLTAWVKGSNQGVPPRFYVTDGTKRAAVTLADYVTLTDRWQLVQIPLSAFTVQGLNGGQVTGFEVVFEYSTGSGTLWIDNVRIGGQGAPQVDSRVLHLRNMDDQPLALHTTNGAAWRISSDVPWLFAASNGAGPDSLEIKSLNWNLAPGVYTGKLQIQNAAGQSEGVAVVLTITEPGAPAQQLFLPMVTR